MLAGRSAASAARAEQAGMVAVADERALLDGAEFFLSILPPGEAEGLARRLAPALTAMPKKPVYLDCNAVSPQTAIRIGEILSPDRRRITSTPGSSAGRRGPATARRSTPRARSRRGAAA